jgi:hypothetical protein
MEIRLLSAGLHASLSGAYPGAMRVLKMGWAAGLGMTESVYDVNGESCKL